MQSYDYRGFLGVAFALGRFSGTVLALLGVCVSIYAAWVYLQDPAASGVLCLGGMWGAGVFVGGLFFVFNYPSVVVDATGIQLRSWPYPAFSIPWSDVIGVQAGHGLKSRLVFVSVRKISPVHLLYGIYFSKKIQAGFLVRTDISGFASLQSVLARKHVV